jgi:two-component system, cell cycle sensor histidine kinase and response regulator CckA
VAALRVLLVDDSEDDAELLLRELRRHAYTPISKRVADPDALRAALTERWDVVICDWSMPGFDGLAAFKVVHEIDPDMPVIIASGTVDEEIAVAALKAGVHDFVGKNKLTRLVPAIQREIREAEIRRERRRADAEVARQRELVAHGEDRYRAMFDNSPTPMWTFDRDTMRFVAVNDAAIRHYGYSRDEFLSMTLADIRPSQDVGALRQDVAQSRGISDRRVWRHRKKDGSLMSVEVRANDLAVDGKRLRLVLINDVTERERPPRRPLSLWLALAVLLGVAVFTLVSTNLLVRTMDRAEHSHALLEALDAVGERYGDAAQTPQQVAAALADVQAEMALDLNTNDADQQKRFEALETAVTAHDTPAVERELDAWVSRTRNFLGEQHAETERQVQLERIGQLVATCLSIAILWLLFSRLMREAGLRRAAEAVTRQSEESLSTMLHSIGDGVIATDREAKVVRINRVAQELTGWTAAEATGRPFTEVFRVDNAALVTRSGARIPIAESTAPIADATGAVTGAIVVFRDVSAERMHEDQLVSLNEELERRVFERTAALQKTEEQLRQSQKIEAIGRLAGGIAHDFNNLLSVIISFSELIIDDAEKDKLPANVIADLDEVKKAGLRAADLTRQLLAFSRQQVLAPKIVDLNDIVGGMEKLLRRVIGADITLRTVRSTDGAKVKVDPGQMEQVIMNLVVNARDAMPRGGKLTIEVSRAELDATFTADHQGIAPGSYIQLAVTDTGMGMSKDVQAQIFEPFFTTKEKGKGTGLGLSTVFGIVQQSGGTIWVYSEPGTGTTFKIYLPITQEASAAATAVAPIVRPRGSETILLVEDEPQVRAIARGILTRAGYTVLEAEDGAAALQLCERVTAPIHLVLTDVVMPVMSGRELVEKLSTVRPSAKVLFMSGYTDDTVVHHGVLDHGIAFLQKPIMPDALTKKVRDVLDGTT